MTSTLSGVSKDSDVGEGGKKKKKHPVPYRSDEAWKATQKLLVLETEHKKHHGVG